MNQELATLIRDQIKRSNENYITFAEYMQQCLYHPRYGYYMKATVKIGKQGDFYTSSSVHPVFAQVFVDIAVQVSEIDKRPISFLEIGAGTGQYASQFLNSLEAKYPAFYQECKYYIQEKSPEHVRQQKEKLEQHRGKVEWLADLQDCAGFRGIVFTNELFDAFPVHLAHMVNGTFYEIAVSWSEESGAFVEQRIPPSRQVTEYIEKHKLQFQEGQRLEIPIAASQWMQSFAPAVQDALWFIIDYGYTTEQLSYPQYSDGSLLCYYKHQVDDNPLEYPGYKDITSHIHFDSLVRDASAYGWESMGLFPQHQFLLQAGIMDYLEEHNGSGDPFNDEGMKRNRAIRHFIFPEGISGAFNVLPLVKGEYKRNAKSYTFLKPFSFL